MSINQIIGYIEQQSLLKYKLRLNEHISRDKDHINYYYKEEKLRKRILYFHFIKLVYFEKTHFCFVYFFYQSTIYTAFCSFRIDSIIQLTFQT